MASGYVHTGECVYLPNRRWSLRMFPCPRDDRVYQDLLDDFHRRSGWIVYRPVCAGCQECRPIRIPVAEFRPSKSQRRCLKRNADLRMEIGPPLPTEEKLRLHNRFVADRFDKGDGGFPSLEAYAEVFGRSPVSTREMRFYLRGRLVGVGIVDLLPDVLSSVYFYFDPDEAKRSLGTLSALKEIEYARDTGRAYTYLGYYIRGCREMAYKDRFRPSEVLDPDGVWRRLERSGAKPLPRA